MTADDTALILFDDDEADGWAPFSLTRPIGELLFGRWRLRARIEAFTGRTAAGHLTRSWLRRFHEAGAPPVIGREDVPTDRSVLLWSSRAVPSPGARFDDGPANLWIGDRVAGVSLPPGDRPETGWLANPTPIPGWRDERVEGEWLDSVTDLVSRMPARLEADLRASLADVEAPLPEGVSRLGDAPVSIGEGVRIEPGVLLDAREGPLEIGPGVEVRAGCRLAGPLYIGEDSRLLGGAVSTLAAGPHSNLRGEIEETTVLGFSNKAHDGFLGHAYVGAWVNLGALTTNSDLKNNYGTIRIGPPEAQIDTGLLKLGCLLGDHVKTGIGVMLNTGTIIGAGSNVYGAEMPPKWVPPFSWGRGAELGRHRREAFLETAATVAERRDVPADERLRGWLEDVWEEACS